MMGLFVLSNTESSGYSRGILTAITAETDVSKAGPSAHAAFLNWMEQA